MSGSAPGDRAACRQRERTRLCCLRCIRAAAHPIVCCTHYTAQAVKHAPSMWLKWRLKWSPGGACRVNSIGLPSLTLIYSSKKQRGKTQAATEREERSVGEQQLA